MTAQPVPGDQAVLTQAAELVALGMRACEGYGREDLGARLAVTSRTLADPAVHIVVAGEFKQGKSSLVNALLGANVCPVDDDVATAVPTYLRYGPELKAELLYAGDPPRRETIPMDDVRRYVVESGDGLAGAPTARVAGVEVALPRTMLSGGLIVVDTPGVGGLGSAHAAASLAAISVARAVIFVTDASQELTRTEVDFLRRARSICDTVICVMTKTDFYPAWRRIRDLNAGHLRADGIGVLCVSSSLRARAVQANDAALNTESGFPELVRFVTEQVGAGAARRLAGEASAEVSAVCDQIIGQFEAERAALADPAAAQAVMDALNVTKQRVEALRTAAAKWSQTLGDGIGDLNSDIDHDLRTRIRKIAQEADEALEELDPADAWDEIEAWLESLVSYEVLENYGLLRYRAEELSAQVAEHFREAAGGTLAQLGVFNPDTVVSQTRIDANVELEKMRVGKQAMVAMKSAYSGAIMFTMLSSMAGIALGPIGVGIGLVMGRKGLRDEKKRLLEQRRAQAKNAVRRYCDEVNFVMGKDSRDTIRRVQRQLRDHYSGLADQLNRSNAEALAGATDAARSSESDRAKRLRDLDAELGRLRQVRQRAAAMAGQ